MTTTEKLLKQLNELRGLKYLEVGYSYFADIKGHGIPSKAIYTIINANGGITRSELNATTSRERCQKIRAAIEEEYSKMNAPAADGLKRGSLIRIHQEDGFTCLAIVTEIDNRWIHFMPQVDKIVSAINKDQENQITVEDWMENEGAESGIVGFTNNPETRKQIEVLGDIWTILGAVVNTK